MQKGKLEHRFPFSFEKLIAIREERYQHLDIWDMFSAAILLQEDDNGKIRRREYKLLIRTALPLFAQKLLANGEALSCYEITTLDREKQEYTSDTRLRLVNSAIKFCELSLYTPDGVENSYKKFDLFCLAGRLTSCGGSFPLDRCANLWSASLEANPP
ncbi:MAG: hypothetical protein N2Z22_01515 [Turneriella sp.]|nr:hypothetical protein [Turneriella sp.]